ncbi:MAG: type II toxin-antitoxin system PemK/MazF family toxin [Spirochaetales bacterium]
MLKRGEIWLAELNPPRGTEPGKVRPVLLFQHQDLLDIGHPSTLVLPLTTNLIDDAEPLRYRLQARGQLERDSDVLVDQLRALDSRRLVSGPLALVDEEVLRQIGKAVSEVLGL